MSSAVADLDSNIHSLKFVTKAPKFLWSNILQSLSLVIAEYCSIFSNLDIYSKYFEPISSIARFDKREELTNIISIDHNIS